MTKLAVGNFQSQEEGQNQRVSKRLKPNYLVREILIYILNWEYNFNVMKTNSPCNLGTYTRRNPPKAHMTKTF